MACFERDGALAPATPFPVESEVHYLRAQLSAAQEKIANLEATLKAAEYAAKVNWEGWQQEIARSSTPTP